MAIRTADRTILVSEAQAAFIQGDCRYELFLGGIGSGKTTAGAIKAVREIARGPTLGMVVAPSFRMLRDATWRTCLEVWRDRLDIVTAVLRGDELRMELATGAEVIFRSAEDPEHLRGPNLSWCWIDEGALCKPEAWQIMIGRVRQYGRLGPCWITTTPKGANWVYRVFESEATDETRVYRGTSATNPFLPEGYVRSLRSQYTERLARQELGGEFLTDTPGALWHFSMFEDRRAAPDLVRVVVAIDPSGGSDPDADEQGIIVAGQGVDGRGYVLADRSCRLSPDGWARRVVQAYLDFHADRIVYERNYGGEMVAATIQTAARAMGVTATPRPVVASRGKRVRAEPIAALYEQAMVTHCEPFDDLESQLTGWTPESGTSPDRLDALVWALTELLLDDYGTLEVA